MKKGGNVCVRKLLFVSKLSLALILGCVIAVTLLRSYNRGEIFKPASATGTGDSEAVDLPAQAHNLVDDCSVIVERSIFGTAGLPSGRVRSDPGYVSAGLFPSAARELGLELVGTVSGSPTISRAVIKNTETKAVDLYRVGQTIAGASIESVESNAVILLHNGHRKMLSLRAAETRSGSGTPAPSAKPGADAGKVVTTKSVSSVRQAPKQTPVAVPTKIGYVEDILTKAVIQPYAVNGQVQGLRITGLEKVRAAEALGLKNGDIIRLVNGQQLTSLQKAFQVFQKAKSQPTISLELSRGGDTKTLTFDLQ